MRVAGEMVGDVRFQVIQRKPDMAGVAAGHIDIEPCGRGDPWFEQGGHPGDHVAGDE